MSVNVDDTSSSILYSGDWDEIVGSTRQWGGGTVHSTSQHGASATITFTGTRIVMYCTLFHGTGNEIANINFDGQTTTVSQPSQSQDVYNDVWFDSGEILGVQHTLIVSNGGGPSDTPLQLDQFFIDGVVDAPSAPPPPPPSPPPTPTQALQQKTTIFTQVTTAVITDNPGGTAKTSSSSSSSRPGSVSLTSGSPSTSSLSSPGASSHPMSTNTILGGTTVVSIQYIPTASVNGSSPSQVANSSESSALNSGSKKITVGGIVGGIIGALFLILFFILILFLLRRRKKAKQHVLLADDVEKVNARPRNLTAVTPFPIETNATPDQQPTTTANSHQALFGSKYSPPAAEVQEAISPASATSSTGMYLANSASPGPGSIEKHPDFFSDFSHHSLSPFMDVTPSNPHHRDPSYPHHSPHDQDQGAVLHRLRPLSDDTVVAPAPDPTHVSPPYADDILRPPSYHQNPGD